MDCGRGWKSVHLLCFQRYPYACGDFYRGAAGGLLHEHAPRRILFIGFGRDLEKTDITISKNLVESENRDLFITRVPGTFGENVKYLTIKKEDIITINGGKTFLTFLNKNQEYELLDKNKKPVGKMRGEELRDNYYDRVGEEIRKRANKQRNKERQKKEKVKKHQERESKPIAKKK